MNGQTNRISGLRYSYKLIERSSNKKNEMIVICGYRLSTLCFWSISVTMRVNKACAVVYLHIINFLGKNDNATCAVETRVNVYLIPFTIGPCLR